jgi:hypothetical protein
VKKRKILKLKKIKREASMVTYTYNLSTLDAEAGRPFSIKMV